MFLWIFSKSKNTLYVAKSHSMCSSPISNLKFFTHSINLESRKILQGNKYATLYNLLKIKHLQVSSITSTLKLFVLETLNHYSFFLGHKQPKDSIFLITYVDNFHLFKYSSNATIIVS